MDSLLQGMISSAHAVQLKLESEHILEKAFEGYDVSTEVETCTQYACNLNAHSAQNQMFRNITLLLWATQREPVWPACWLFCSKDNTPNCSAMHTHLLAASCVNHSNSAHIHGPANMCSLSSQYDCCATDQVLHNQCGNRKRFCSQVWNTLSIISVSLTIYFQLYL